MLLQHPSPSPSPKTLTNPFISPSIFPNNNLFTPHFRRTSFLLRASSASDPKTLTKSAIQRIADKLRALGYVSEEEKQGNISNQTTVNKTLTLTNSPGEIFVPLPDRIPKHRVGHTLDPSWSTPDNPVPEPGSGTAIRRYNQIRKEVLKEKVKRRDEESNVDKEKERVPTMAELKVSSDELRRLRGVGIGIKKVLKIGKAGITEGIVNGIHERWRNTELVKIVCEDMCRLNMKRSHDLLERKTGGLVVWRSGSIIILYRGADYKYPYFFANNVKPNDASVGESMSLSMDSEGGAAQESYIASTDDIASSEHMKTIQPPLIQGVGSRTRVRFQLPGEAQLAEEADQLLHGLGPRFIDWYGYDPLPVDADLLPAIVPGYRKPFRLLPFGVQPKLTNDEMTTLRRLGRPLPCHFALGRNRKHQGLAAAILKLWEKCEIAKIAVKRGVQNTNSELMAEELKWLTGGTLLTRDKEYIVLYRGKDFLPATVSSAIEQRRNRGVDGLERKKITSSSDVQENKVKEMRSPVTELGGIRDQKLEIAIEQRKQRSREAAIKKTSSKLSQALESKEKAEKLLEELEKGKIKQPLEVDKEGITEEERYMLRKVGMKMKPFLLLGRRGVFDGTVENMHLHWKYRELVKILCGETSIDEIHAVARTLEAESGGILVAVERVRKGHAIIVYRGKNYKRPPTLRPQTLLNKREALTRYVETQRRESLKLHVLKLGKDVEDLKFKLAKSEEAHIQGDKDQNIQLEQEKTNPASENMEPDSDFEVHKSNSSHVDYGQEREVPGEALFFSSEIDPLQDPVTRCEDRLRDSSMEFKKKDCVDFSDAKVDMNPQRDRDECEFTETNSKASIMSMKETCESESAKTHKASTSPVEFKPEGLASDEPSVSLTRSEVPFSTVPEPGVNKSNEKARRSSLLSNRERLLLRQQALKMKKRPVLAVGRSNIVTGVAKTIKTHFQKHPLAIVNIKGRARGTSVQEVVSKLEEATGAIMVSQEPNKVILYRGWGATTTRDSNQTNGKYKPSDNEGTLKPIISPELISAIRFECGLQNNRVEQSEVVTENQSPFRYRTN
uniref:CRM-domain containing factor CFM2, chloroplastic n=1 Tax=Erigeron canadensis TaxID=72917 RepID=UPI001CB8C156|nr:CRM-domain containing factor CFM2, chloroplastic [Erigeron canadensis]